METVIISSVTEWCTDDLNSISALLIKVVEEGASLGFLPPLSMKDSLEYWRGVLEPNVRLWVVRDKEEIVGTIQLQLCTKQNGRHLAEIAKLMVHPKARRSGIARQLMNQAETIAKKENRSLIVLDTRLGDPSNVLYQSLGYVEAGRIPQYARSADGNLDSTVIYYKFI